MLIFKETLDIVQEIFKIYIRKAFVSERVNLG